MCVQSYVNNVVIQTTSSGINKSIYQDRISAYILLLANKQEADKAKIAHVKTTYEIPLRNGMMLF